MNSIVNSTLFQIVLLENGFPIFLVQWCNVFFHPGQKLMCQRQKRPIKDLGLVSYFFLIEQVSQFSFFSIMLWGEISAVKITIIFERYEKRRTKKVLSFRQSEYSADCIKWQKPQIGLWHAFSQRYYASASLYLLI